MGWRDPGEPEYPRSRAEVDATCERLAGALRTHLSERLRCVLLCGSWARDEARPPESDLDLTVVIDTVDASALEALRRAWEDAGVGPANIYGADEVPLLARGGLEQHSTNARVLWGNNPFDAPTRADFARDLAQAAESIGRYARSALVYPWMSPELKVRELRRALSKWDMRWALRCLAAYRTGVFPRHQEELHRALAGSPEEPLLEWCDELTDEELGRRSDEFARQINQFVRSWFQEISPSLSLNQQTDAPPRGGATIRRISDG